MSPVSARRTCRVLLLSLLALAGCDEPPEVRPEAAFHVSEQGVRIHRKGPIGFSVSEARLGPALPLPPVTARITTVETLTSPSFAPLAGRVVEARVRLGDHVEKGQRLVLVRTADLPTLEREVRSAALAVKTHAASVERMRALVAARAGSENDLLLAQSELEEAKLAEQAARARLRSLQIARGKDDTDYWVLANRSGTVVQLEAAPGAQVGPDRGAPVATVADLAEVLAVADVPPHQAAELRKGTAVQIFPFGAASGAVAAQVEMVSDVVDPDRQTVPVRVRASNQKRLLRPNAYVDLLFGTDDATQRVLLAAEAVVRDGPNAVVFVRMEDGALVRRPVVVGRRTRDEVEIVSGLKPGEQVVTTGALLLVNALDIGSEV